MVDIGDNDKPKLINRNRVECPKYSQLVSRKGAKSNIWEYFGCPADENAKIISDNVSVCKLCQRAVSSKATSNLWSHIKCYHPVQFQRLNSSFPKDERKRKEWEDKVSQQRSKLLGIPRIFTASKNSRICSKHFSVESYSENSLERRNLKDNTVPSIFQNIDDNQFVVLTPFDCVTHSGNTEKNESVPSSSGPETSLNSVRDCYIKCETLDSTDSTMIVDAENPQEKHIIPKNSTVIIKLCPASPLPSSSNKAEMSSANHRLPMNESIIKSKPCSTSELPGNPKIIETFSVNENTINSEPYSTSDLSPNSNKAIDSEEFNNDAQQSINSFHKRFSSKNEEIDLLFMSYAETFKRFSRRRQASLKISLANLFGQAELEEMNEQH